MTRQANAVACPSCKAQVEENCRTMTTGQVTDTHVTRIDAYWLSRSTRLGRRGGEEA